MKYLFLTDKIVIKKDRFDKFILENVIYVKQLWNHKM